MAMSGALRRWLRLPSKVALLLGMGALSTSGAQAATTMPAADHGLGGATIRVEGDKLYLLEGGVTREVWLGDAVKANTLRDLLQKRQAARADLGGISVKPMILAGAGGAGIHWAPQGKQPAAKTPTGNTTNNGGSPPTPQKPADATGTPGRANGSTQGQNG